MIRAVLDANVFVSAILSPRGVPAKILAAWRAELFSLVISEPILDEIGRVLRYPRIEKRHRWSEERIQTFLDDLARLAIFTPSNLSLSVVARDPADDRYLERAVEGESDYLVSGDEHLLDLGTYQSVYILSPKDFLDALKEQAKSQL